MSGPDRSRTNKPEQFVNCDTDATVGTSECQAQRELPIGAPNNELREGSFAPSRSN